jgi:predicted dehydrogenase
MRSLILVIPLVIVLASYGQGGQKKQQDGKAQDQMTNNYEVHLLTVDPGHFHAALVQKTMYPQVSPVVYVYAPEGPDCRQHLDRINMYNTRPENPTSWKEIVYTGPDFFEKMIGEKKGNVVILSGNNRRKADYIDRCINAGLNVLADKPMIINPGDFNLLLKDFQTAREKGILLYDIMTERYEITTILQKLLSQKEEIFGKLETGSEKEPAVTKISVHHFSKMVSGKPLQRPAWYFDVRQQGEGIVDVTTHLVDLIQWECFPEQVLDTSDVAIASAKRWPTSISREQFSKVTGLDDFPAFLASDIRNGSLNVFSNGEIVYKIKGKWAKVSVTWNFEAPPGGGDTHYSVMKGSGCDIVIRQGSAERYIPTLYIENIKGDIPGFTSRLKEALGSMPYDSLEIVSMSSNSLKINIPSKYRVSHEEHFSQVTARFLEYLKKGKLPEWEVNGMITKYYTTTRALKKATGF